MKYIDKFLKKLGTNRNTFATYILTLLTVYLAVDRIVEMLFMIFTGVSISYWGPIKYTFALACPAFAYAFSGASAFATSKKMRVTLFNVYCIGLYIIAISMFTQWLNQALWLILISLPSYVEIVTDFSDLIKPAFSAISAYLPLVTFYPMFKWVFFDVNDTRDAKRSIWDYKGIDLSDKKSSTGPYTCEVYLCNDKETGKTIKIADNRRCDALLVCGPSGTGKTGLVFEPIMARDIEKKYFFNEVSKELGFTALKTGIATLNSPYDNDYLNKNFNLNMLIPNSSKSNLFKAFMKKMILSESGDDIVYKNLGITYVSPDYDSMARMADVAENFNIPYNIIDPSNSNSLGINPFIYEDPTKIAIAVSSVLKGLYNTTHADVNSISVGAAYEDVALHAIENVSILLKETYPVLHDGDLPNLDDVLKVLTNPSLVETYCKVLERDEELKEKYNSLISYFKMNFYTNGSGRKSTEANLTPAISQLDNLLRYPGVKNVLCNRTNNINFDKALKNGEITFVCTRRGDLGATAHKAFGLFFLLAMQNSILRRPGNEKNRIPHFLYIDEFPDFICSATASIFTLYRKYKVGIIISAQSLSQLDDPTAKTKYKQTILTNCTNKIVFGNSTPEDAEWWAKEFGKKRDWEWNDSYDGKTGNYDPKKGNVKWAWVNNFKEGKIQSLGFKTCIYKINSDKGAPMVGEAKLDFMSSKYKEKQPSKSYNFNKFTNGIVSNYDEEDNKKLKFDPKKVNFIDERNEIDPVQTDTTDSKFLYDNEDAIIFNLKKGNSND